MVPAERVGRFRADLEKLTEGAPAKLGVAVSGGPDSLALLLLAAAALPGRVCAATVDHGLRPDSAAEARFVADLCRRLSVPHEILSPDWEAVPSGNLPARARNARYLALSAWLQREGTPWLATAHHLDDQAETLLMRLARGAGVAGLAGVRGVNRWSGQRADLVVRPLLHWRKAELIAIVRDAGLEPVLDPTNDSDALDRTHARRLLASVDWLDAARLAASAANLADAQEALGWAMERVWEERGEEAQDGRVTIDARGLPRELQRRLLLRALGRFTDENAIAGPKLIGLLDTLLAGRAGTLAGVKVEPGEKWRLAPAPPRRDAPR
jgi:tRNA(Ile)-lysidine synthase